MQLTGRFLLRWAVWTVGLVTLVWVAATLGPAQPGPGTAQVLTWLGGMLAFAAFPAGIAVAERVVDWDGPRPGRLVGFTGLAMGVALAVFVLRGYLAPALLPDSVSGEAEIGSVAADPVAFSLGERIEAIRIAEAEAERLETQDAWLLANRIGWHVDGTIAGAIAAFVFAWLGVLVGAWARWTGRRDVRQAQYWAVGLFLLMTGYLMGENSYELILLKMNGPAYVTAWFPLIAPGMLCAGLAFATGARILAALAPPGLLSREAA